MEYKDLLDIMGMLFDEDDKTDKTDKTAGKFSKGGNTMRKDFKEINALWDKLLEMDLFTKGELQLITNINGYSVETLNAALFARYGYRDLEQMMDYD